MKHTFEPAENHMPSTDTDWCKFKYCPKCGCLKEIWRNGVSFRIGNKFYDKEPKCIKINHLNQNIMSESKKQFMEMRESDQNEELPQVGKPIAPSVQVERGFLVLVSLDAAAIDTLARAKVNEVAEGNADAAKLFALGQKISLLGTTIIDNIKGYVYGKTYATKGETYTIDGVELTPSALGVKYDYASSQDPTWDTLNAEFETIKKAKENREKFLKTIPEKMNIVTDDGEGITIYAPIKTETQGYKTKIK